MAWLLWLSVGDGLEHYRDFFGNSAYLRILAGTFLLATETTLLCLLAGYPVAWFLHRLPGRWRVIGLLLVVVPYLTSFLARTYAWIVLLADNGVINGTLLALGVTHSPVKLLYEQTAVLIGMTHIMLPFMVLPLYNVMRQIDPRLMQAARSLGSGAARSFLRIFLPLSAPGIRSGAMLVFVLSLGFYITPLALGRERDITLAGLIEVQVFQLLDLGLAAASAIILLLLTFFALAIFGGELAGDTFAAVGAGTRRKRMSTARRLLGEWRDHLGNLAGLDRLATWLGNWHERRRQRLAQSGVDRRGSMFGSCFTALAVLTLVLLLLPTLLVIPMSFNDSQYLGFPPESWSLRWYRHFLTDPAWLAASWLSLRTALVAMLLATVCGTLAAYALFAHRFAGQRFLVAALMSPLIVPAVVLGIGLYDLYVRWHLVGTPLGIALAHGVVAIPYVLATVTASLASFDPALERASASLGAGGFTTFRRVTLPLILPGVVSGALFAFIHSFDEVVTTLFVGGYVARTLPLKMWENIRHEIDPTIAAISTLLLLMVLAGLIIARGGARLWRASKE